MIDAGKVAAETRTNRMPIFTAAFTQSGNGSGAGAFGIVGLMTALSLRILGLFPVEPLATGRGASQDKRASFSGVPSKLSPSCTVEGWEARCSDANSRFCTDSNDERGVEEGLLDHHTDPPGSGIVRMVRRNSLSRFRKASDFLAS
jgi:hypothetical protein